MNKEEKEQHERERLEAVLLMLELNRGLDPVLATMSFVIWACSSSTSCSTGAASATRSR